MLRPGGYGSCLRVSAGAEVARVSGDPVHAERGDAGTDSLALTALPPNCRRRHGSQATSTGTGSSPELNEPQWSERVRRSRRIDPGACVRLNALAPQALGRRPKVDELAQSESMSLTIRNTLINRDISSRTHPLLDTILWMVPHYSAPTRVELAVPTDAYTLHFDIDCIHTQKTNYRQRGFQTCARS